MKITGTQKDLDELVKKNNGNSGLNMPEIPSIEELKKKKENEELRKVFKGQKK